jgi:LasA protease
MPTRALFFILFGLLLLVGCTRSADTLSQPPAAPSASPNAPQLGGVMPEQVASLMPATRLPGAPISTPTPDATRIIPTLVVQTVVAPTAHVVQPGDYLGVIAARYGVTVNDLLTANPLPDPNRLEVGQVIILPITPVAVPSSMTGPGFKIIPDSELFYGPYSASLDVPVYVTRRGGYLTFYTEEVEGKTLSGGQIVAKVAREFSVNPRLLLALIEYRSGWVTNPNPSPVTFDYPLGLVDPERRGLYRQLSYAADWLNFGFYQWHEHFLTSVELKDKTLVSLNGGINAGTAGVQQFFAKTDNAETWLVSVGEQGLFATYERLFGYPFDVAIEPILPPNLTQPPMTLPFAVGETWSFTGGPHGGWGLGSAWAGLDFAPPGESQGCALNDYWVLAVTDGLIVHSADGQVVQDLDGDGLEQTGWTVLYLHIDTRNRIPAGTFARAGDRIGHPSCEGGFTRAVHLHLARRYNGMWIGADTEIPFNLDGWISIGADRQYNGFLSRNGITIEAWDRFTPLNQITR